MKNVKKWALPAFTLVLTVVTSLFWVALRVNYSGISKFLGADENQSFLIMNLPVMVCVLSWLGAAAALAGLLLWNRKKWPTVTALVIGLITFVGGLVVVYFGAKDYLRFIMVHFWESMAVTALLTLFALALFFPVSKRSAPVLAGKGLLLGVLVLLAVVLGYQLRPCGFSYGAVVYAVEDDYQIVFSTSDNSVAWVEIGGEAYYDTYAGSLRSADRVHKVTVPQQVLDAAGGYTTCAQQMIYRGPFGGYKGPQIRRDYSFRPVDSSDGLQYHAISDVHEAVAAAEKSVWNDSDFIVLLGDLISMVETERDAQLANELAHGITKGQIPVIYARGNHEIKGEYAEELYNYVGSKNQNFYYWYTLGADVFGVVLDMGEDHEDDWWEYYGTARFYAYRDEQSQMLRELIAGGFYQDYEYRMALCHIPLVYVDRHGYFEEHRLEWTELLNEMEMDISLSGHKHVLWYLVPGAEAPGGPLEFSEAFKGKPGVVDGGYLTDFRFPTFLVGRRSLEQAGKTQADGSTDYCCLYVRVTPWESQSASYVNSSGKFLEICYPFVSISGKRTQVESPLN